MAVLARLRRFVTGEPAKVAALPAGPAMIAPAPADPGPDPVRDAAVAMLDAYLDEARAFAGFRYDTKAKEFPAGRAILEADRRCQVAVVLAAVAGSRDALAARSQHVNAWRDQQAHDVLVAALVRRRLPLSGADLDHLLALLVAHGDVWSWCFPLPAILGAIAGSDAGTVLTTASRANLGRLRAAGASRLDGKRLATALERIDALLGEVQPAAAIVDERDEWGPQVRATLAAMDDAERDAWRGVLEHAAKATGATPSGVWRTGAGERVAAMGGERFAATATAWLELLGRSPVDPGERDGGGNGLPPVVLAERNGDLLKGLAWACAEVGTPAVARALGAAAEACFKKIPGVGARSLKVGNACLWALGEFPGTEGAIQLLRLRHRVTFPPARKAIEAAVERAALRAGMDREDLDDLAVPTYDLVDGRRRVDFGDCTAEIVVSGVNRVELRWSGADGKARRTEPAALKRAFPDERKALKATVADLNAVLPAQRDRIERLLLGERTWALAGWRERYLDHPLLSVLARPLIWRFADGDRVVLGAWRDGELVGADDRGLADLSPATRVGLWHPIGSDPGVVEAWQRWLEAHGIVQPFKQAHREVYVLTEAERRTVTYSNRFAGHLLRQHQFLALCQARGWRYRLQAGFDNADTPTIALPAHGLAVEFWVEPVTEGEGSLTDRGTSYLISTDQVRFVRTAVREPVPLAEVPPLVLTELLRDVDLFVGVASVGNDPTWRDRGPEQHRRYWTDYAFGDLSATAETRRAVLGRLVPRLAIADRCALEDRFLVVRGDRRTYKIHLGSGNILMEPNNQYLCIVPGRGAAVGDPSSGVFLPFEGDTQLAVILSKAFLLAADTAITDPTILRQLDRWPRAPGAD